MLNCTLKEIITKLKTKSVTAKQLCGACLKRAEKTLSLNAFITLTPELAKDRAAISDEKIENGTLLGLLEGVPVAFKDNFSSKGVQTSCGSHMLTGYKPPYNATVVQKMLDQGALLMGKTNMDEFAMGSGSIDSVFGPVKNPWGYNFSKSSSDTLSEEGRKQEDQDWHVTGGSSGGSAVAVATGVCFAALGSDTGGSTRSPAAYCGVVGLKPTYGRLSRNGLIPLVNSLDVPGIVTKTTEDAAVILNVLSGHDVRDSTTVTDTHSLVQLPEDISLTDITIGIPKEYHAPGVDRQVLEAWQRSADLFADGGVKLVDVSLPHSQYSIVCYHILCNCEVASNMARFDGIEYGLQAEEDSSTEALYAASRHQGFNQVVRGRILAGNYFLLKTNYENYFVRAQKIRRLIQDDFKKVFNAGVDLLLTPVVQSVAPKYSWFLEEDSRTRSEQQDIYTQPVNLAGLPAVTLPVHLSQEGLPISLQLIGKPFQEDLLLRAARWLEQRVNFQRLNLDHLDLEPL